MALLVLEYNDADIYRMHNINCQAESANDTIILELEEQHCRGQHMSPEYTTKTYTKG